MHPQVAIQAFEQFCTKLRYGKVQQEHLHQAHKEMATAKEIPINVPEQSSHNINTVYIGHQQISLTVPSTLDSITGMYSLLLPIQPHYAIAIRLGQSHPQLTMHACYCIHHMKEDDGKIEYLTETTHYLWSQASQQASGTFRLHADSLLYFPASVCSSQDSCLVIEYIL